MTKIAIIAAIALNVGITSGFGQFDPDFVTTLSPTVPTQSITADLGGDLSASHKVSCIMPPAQQTHCKR